MTLGSKMGVEMGPLAFTAQYGCFKAPTAVRAPPIRPAAMRALRSHRVTADDRPRSARSQGPFVHYTLSLAMTLGSILPYYPSCVRGCAARAPPGSMGAAESIRAHGRLTAIRASGALVGVLRVSVSTVSVI